MNISTFTPKNVNVKTIVDRYILMESKESSQVFTCFPNTNHCLGIVLNKKIKSIKNGCVNLEPSNRHTHYISGIYTKPLRFRVSGVYTELCIDFKPLAFESMGLPSYFHGDFLIEPLIKTNKKLIDKLYELVSQGSLMAECNIVAELDQIINGALSEQHSHFFAVLNNEDIKDIETLKHTLFQSERTLYRSFKEHLSISPYRFIEIKKLQSCLKDIMQAKQLKFVVYDNDLVDYSHLNKLIKKYTSHSPSDFKQSISMYNDLILKH